ncbi:hypothetical protein BGZ96_010502 [Linnemannia gamsii]|uniref:Uncharacterized protein n=1 Tax=Linnemannia gamsii TaxID=64522 RepID=A0ABQ7KBX2_9FUNG|nr:hypothetical protein BGZ96_010502 [Linnemannia gamsii]
MSREFLVLSWAVRLPQNVVKSRVLDGTWKMTRYSYAATAPVHGHGYGNISGVHLGQGGCSKQENLIWKVDDKSFSQVLSNPDILFGSSGIWEIQSLVPIAGNSDHTLKQELKPSYLKLRAYKDGTIPLDLCMATQVLPPETSSNTISAFSSLTLIKTNGQDVPQLTVMVDPSNPKQCPSQWVQFGGVCAKGIDFLKGYCESGSCMELFKESKQTPEATRSNTSSGRPEVGAHLSVNWVVRVVAAGIFLKL